MDISELKALITSLLAEVKRLKGRVHEVETENEELRTRLAQNSANSHKPPSSDGLAKKPLIKPALPKQVGKKPGGQPGHPGKTLLFAEQPDVIYTHQSTQCHQCGLPLRGQGQVVARRQVFDLPQPRLLVEEHQVVAHQCACGCMLTGKFPVGVDAPVQYGPRIQAQSVLLNVDYRVPFAKIRQFWADLTGYGYNPATLIGTQIALDAQLMPIETQIKEQLKAAAVCHFDETGVRVGGKLQWLHVASDAHYTYLFVHQKRGQDALLSHQSIYTDCLNWTVHDCWASYFTVGKGRHALCGAHLLRELAALIEAGSHWAKAMHSYLLDAYKASRHGSLIPPEAVHWRHCYEQLCGQADEEERPPLVFFKANGQTGRPRRSKGRNLLDRLVLHQEAVLAFAFEPGVPFTNNQAERDLRPVKVKQRVSGCFRTESGAVMYARISGFVSTMRKNGRNVVDELASVLGGSFQWAT
jgi:transposase